MPATPHQPSAARTAAHPRTDLTAGELTALLALARRPQVGCSRQELIDAGIPAGSIGFVVGSGTATARGLLARGYVRVTQPELPTGGRLWYKITSRGLWALTTALAAAEAGVKVEQVTSDKPHGGNRMAEFLAVLTPPAALPERPDAGDILPGEVLPELVPAEHRA